mmetsp:Transcript_112728/g.318603  ORF Transcript_112728/g.318603 Transcript_112728/m.318603 type:complete len:268 (-) Transcript_112728:40-843(-)
MNLGRVPFREMPNLCLQRLETMLRQLGVVAQRLNVLPHGLNLFREASVQRIREAAVNLVADLGLGRLDVSKAVDFGLEVHVLQGELFHQRRNGDCAALLQVDLLHSDLLYERGQRDRHGCLRIHSSDVRPQTGERLLHFCEDAALQRPGPWSPGGCQLLDLRVHISHPLPLGVLTDLQHANVVLLARDAGHAQGALQRRGRLDAAVAIEESEGLRREAKLRLRLLDEFSKTGAGRRLDPEVAISEDRSRCCSHPSDATEQTARIGDR